jgi:hypothetical protein
VKVRFNGSLRVRVEFIQGEAVETGCMKPEVESQATAEKGEVGRSLGHIKRPGSSLVCGWSLYKETVMLRVVRPLVDSSQRILAIRFRA